MGMLNKIIEVIAGGVPKAIVDGILRSIVTSQFRKNVRRAIRDLVEDEQKEALTDLGVDREEAHRYVKSREGRLKKEIRARFDAILQK